MLIRLCLLSLCSVALALKCNIVASGNLNVTDTTTAQECPLGALTCIKLVDYTRGTYTKQCQSINCTMNGMSNAAANCMNTSGFGVTSATCCCYGDGCNSTPTNINFILPAALIIALSIYSFMN